jgi:hypothetical protein
MKIEYNAYIKIKKNIIKKLYAHNAFQRAHLLYERLITGIPPHLIGFVKLVLKELIQEEIVLVYGKTKHGEAYQLNIDKLKEIEEVIFEQKNKR